MFYLDEQMELGAPLATISIVCHHLFLHPSWELHGFEDKAKAAATVLQVSRNCISHHFLVTLEIQASLGGRLRLGFPSLLSVQLGPLLAVRLWSGNHHHQGAQVYLSPLEDPSGLGPLPHPRRQKHTGNANR